jgi:hypothetical protein
MRKRASAIAGLMLAWVACSKPVEPDKKAVVLPPEPARAPDTPTAAVPGTSPCDLVATSEVSSALGIGVLAGPVVQREGNVTVCQYGDGTNPQRVMIRFESGLSARDLDNKKQLFEQSGQPTSLVPNLGDSALSISASDTNGVHSMVLAFKGSRTIQVAAPAPPDKVQAVTRQIVGKL